jgi:hypothetical protein
MHVLKMEVVELKKLIFGGLMMLSGILGTAILLAGTTENAYSVNGEVSFSLSLSFYGLTPALVAFIIIGIVGLLLSIWGLVEKDI